MCNYATEQPQKHKSIIFNGQQIIKRPTAKVINLATSKTMINKDSRANWWQTPIEEFLVAVNPGLAWGQWRRMRPWSENIEPFSTEEEFTAAKAKIVGIGDF
jgi:hypothetical protein